MSRSGAELLVERRGPTLVMTLNRPEVRNAVNASLAEALACALADLDADEALRVGILTGRGASFCSGLDLKAFLAGEPRSVEGRGFAGLTEAPPAKPLIAAVEGAAMAGGFEMVLACDLVVAGDGASFGLPEVRRGLIAGSGGLIRLPHRIPPQIAMEYALTGDMMSAAEAHRWGLVNRLAPTGEALGTAQALAARIAGNAPLSIAFSKELITGAATWTEAEAWDRQRQRLDTVIASADAREGAEAFVQKRPAVWSGE
ncbi:crotonase/enoyl-CoA hydratase family protein [Conexibacter sp. DBS9H8]|uniref:crotonase/enoyl-CoA hydratase family protein n=1 Tax=Conexibacter sp. DBS9H8 TaxID=2937801 RepID=UPI00200E5581|nr:crotonase/enoyl-CoA hydratase family protein [Conexibacter sp. DBS9H8]